MDKTIPLRSVDFIKSCERAFEHIESNLLFTEYGLLICKECHLYASIECDTCGFSSIKKFDLLKQQLKDVESIQKTLKLIEA